MWGGGPGCVEPGPCQAAKQRWEGTHKGDKGDRVGEYVRLPVPYRQLEQCPFRVESIVGHLVRNGAPGSPEVGRI